MRNRLFASEELREELGMKSDAGCVDPSPDTLPEDQTDTRTDAITEATAAIGELEQYQEIISAVPEGTELPESTAAAIEIAVESLRGRLGMGTRPIGETPVENRAVKLENAIVDTVTKTREAIKNTEECIKS